jgi:hypothetical protein
MKRPIAGGMPLYVALAALVVLLPGALLARHLAGHKALPVVKVATVSAPSAAAPPTPAPPPQGVSAAAVAAVTSTAPKQLTYVPHPSVVQGPETVTNGQPSAIAPNEVLFQTADHAPVHVLVQQFSHQDAATVESQLQPDPTSGTDLVTLSNGLKALVQSSSDTNELLFVTGTYSVSLLADPVPGGAGPEVSTDALEAWAVGLSASLS